MRAHSLKKLLKWALIESLAHLATQRGKIGNRVPVLGYHRVLPELIQGDTFETWSILPEQFELQLKFLSKEGFTTLSLEEYARMARGVDPVRERSVLITIDDGFADNYAIAWKIAQGCQVKINLFICPGYIGRTQPHIESQDGFLAVDAAPPGVGQGPIRTHIEKFPQLWRPLTWEELREMHNSGVQMGLHSFSHHNLAKLRPEKVAADIAMGLEAMERELGERPRYFALPYGWHGDYTPEVIAILTGLGLELLFAAHFGRARLPSRYAVIPRILITQRDNLAIFRQKIWGAYDWWEQISQIRYFITKYLET